MTDDLIPEWRVAGVSVIGSSHASSNDSCQDSHEIHVGTDGRLVMVVSDGAGSAQYGGEGAALACTTVSRLLAGLPKELFDAPPRRLAATLSSHVKRALISARGLAQQEAEKKGGDLSDFDATIVGVVAHPALGGLFFHIGDGAACAISTTDGAWRMSEPENGEYIETTYFYTEDRWRRHLRVLPFDASFDTLILMSDGVTDLAIQRNMAGFSPFKQFWEPLDRHLRQNGREANEQTLREFLNSPSVLERTHDDKTLVWASRGTR